MHDYRFGKREKSNGHFDEFIRRGELRPLPSFDLTEYQYESIINSMTKSSTRMSSVTSIDVWPTHTLGRLNMAKAIFKAHENFMRLNLTASKTGCDVDENHLSFWIILFKMFTSKHATRLNVSLHGAVPVWHSPPIERNAFINTLAIHLYMN